MQKLGRRDIKVTDIQTEPGFKMRLEQKHVEDLAESIDSLVLIHPPLIRSRDLRIISGRDRLAAHMLLERETIECEMVECTDMEAEKLKLAENARRRHDPDAQQRDLVSLVDIREREVLEEEERARQNGETVEPVLGTPGRKKGSRAKARERVAKEVGLKPESIRRAEIRQQALKDSPRKAPDIRLLGTKPSDQWLAGVGIIREKLSASWHMLKRAQTELTQLEGSEVPFLNSALQNLKEAVHDATALVRGQFPYSVCPWCKQAPDITPHCVGCMGLGFLPEVKREQVPDVLWRDEEPVVLFNGQYQPLSRFVAREPEPEQFEDDDIGDEFAGALEDAFEDG